MKAVRLTGPGRVEVTDAPEPGGSGLAIVRAETMGICGTDLKVVAGTVGVEFPRTLGHELVGRVLASPDPRLPEGTRVLADPALACGACSPCRHHRPHLCRHGGLMGREVDGVFAEYSAIDPARLLAVPDTVGQEAAGLLQVLGTCIHGLRTVDLVPGDVALVMGLGVAGQLMVQLLAAAGMVVVGATRSEHKQALAARHGASAVASPGEVAAVLDEVSVGEGPVLVVEAVGTEATLVRSIELAGEGGDVVMFGTATNGGQGLPYFEMYFKELTLWNPRAALLDDYARAIELMAAGTLTVDELVSHSVPLEEAPRAFELAEDPASLKVLVTNS